MTDSQAVWACVALIFVSLLLLVKGIRLGIAQIQKGLPNDIGIPRQFFAASGIGGILIALVAIATMRGVLVAIAFTIGTVVALIVMIALAPSPKR